MPRIPEPEIERLKIEVSVERLVAASGTLLKKSGKDWLGRCPFHEDDTASLVVTPGKNLWHCFGCGIGGGPIDWVIKRQGVSFRHAVELLREGVTPLAAEGVAVKRSTVRALPPPVAFDADDQALLNQTVGYYHERLLATTEAAEYLAARGLAHPELVAHFKLGVADRTLGLRLPEKNRKAGADIRAQLQKIGLIRDSGHEHFNGSLVVPVFDEAGNVVEVYGRKLLDNLRAGTPKHLYLPARESRSRGVFNAAALQASKEIILCEALIDALTFWCAGYRNVTAAYGIEGFTDEHVQAFKRHGTERVLIAYDRDDAGERGAAKVAEVLMAQGIECFRVQFPKGMDANEYALKVTPAAKSLGLLIRKAVWLGKGSAPERAAPGPLEVADCDIKPLAPAEVVTDRDHPAESPSLAAAPAAEPPQAEIDGDTLRLAAGARTWQVRGLPKVNPGASMKLNVRVQGADAALHVDSVDLYSARGRAVFAAQAAAELDGRSTANVSEALTREIGRELGRVLLAVEQAITARERQASAPRQIAPTMTEAEHAAAMDLLTSPQLIARILTDFAAVGLVGEDTNKLVGYLAAMSRKLDRPLGVVIQSSSAAGKSTLMDAVLAFVPEEEKVKYSAMTGQSLFYMGETNLKHKALAIVEEEGASRASYALKLLQSEGELTIASTGKDPQSGNLITQQYRVEGPVALLITTTARDIDEELMNRCLVLAVDEGREQTRAIHERQRARRTLDGLFANRERQALIALHQNAQRLLRPLDVLIPFASFLTFPDQTTRLRRDHEKYLTLIDVIAFVHQHQRPIRVAERAGQRVEYIEATLADVELANAIAHDVLGRSLDELPPQTRRLLKLIDGHVGAECQRQAIRRADYRFARRTLREAIAWGDTQLKVHLARLVELEYLIPRRDGAGGKFTYELAYELADAGDDKHRAQVAGLIDVATLEAAMASTKAAPTFTSTVAKSRGADPEVAGRLRGDSGPVAGMSRAGASADQPASMRVAAVDADDEAQTHCSGLNGIGTPYPHPAIPLAAVAAGA